MKTSAYMEYEKLCNELDRKTKEACEEFKRGMEKLCNHENPVPWDWSTTPPWINWIAMDKYGAWYMYPDEPELRNSVWSCGHSRYDGIPQLHSPQWSGDWKLSKTQRPKGVAK